MVSSSKTVGYKIACSLKNVVNQFYTHIHCVHCIIVHILLHIMYNTLYMNIYYMLPMIAYIFHEHTPKYTNIKIIECNAE